MRSCSNCCSGKAVSITYSECVFVTLGIHRVMQMLHAAIYDLPRPTIFFHFISKTTRYSEKKVTEREICVVIFSTNFV